MDHTIIQLSNIEKPLLKFMHLVIVLWKQLRIWVSLVIPHLW